jgi:hypothetical protein
LGVGLAVWPRAGLHGAAAALRGRGGWWRWRWRGQGVELRREGGEGMRALRRAAAESACVSKKRIHSE